MADQYAISSANLSYIENSLNTIHNNIDALDHGIDVVNGNVQVIYDEVGALAKEFHDYVHIAGLQHNLSLAETRLVKIRQEIETKYGHYSTVRRTTTGILQADDLGIIKRETISNATEELMISTPNYWLAPCLVALAAWINNQPELAKKAVLEGIKRNNEKSSLLFALICRRAGRKSASLKWTQRFLSGQDEENLDRKCVIILDAYASGLLGADTDGVISKLMTEWLDKLASKPGFIEKQTAQWAEAINMKRKPLESSNYTYLRKYSKTWPVLSDILEGAHLHADILEYFDNIFTQEESSDSVKAQLDEILTSLVSDYDDEELPLRKDEKYNQFIVDFDGDDQRAQANMNIEQTAFEKNKDFTQLLTDAAMKPESSHASVSTQKFAIALSRDWISNAYSDVIAQNRIKIPNHIEINIDSFNDVTADGKNEQEMVNKFNVLVDREKSTALSEVKLTGFEQFCMWGGIAIGVIGLIMMLVGSGLLGLIAIVVGIGMVINHTSKKKKIVSTQQNIESQFEEKRRNGVQILRATLAEVVDFRAEFQKKDSESEKVIDFLEQITPDQYVKTLSDSARRIKVAN